MPIPDELSDLHNTIRALYLSTDSFVVPGQAAMSVLEAMGHEELLEIVAIFDRRGIDFDLRHDGQTRLPLTADMPSTAICVYATQYLASFWTDDAEMSAIEEQRTDHSSWALANLTGLMHTQVPMPFLGRDGKFYIPDPEGLDLED